MFGHFCYSLDHGLAVPPRDSHHVSPGRYASELLAELLDRAAVLERLYHYADDVGREDIPEYLERLELLGLAVETFARDCQEARLRGRRALLFYQRANGGLNPDSVESDKVLAELGGSLAPYLPD